MTITAEDRLDRIVELSEKIQRGGVTVLTGGNGSGKSVLRKLLWQTVGEVALVSLDQRTGIDPSFGAQMFARDVEWVPSSLNTLSSVRSLLNSERNSRFIVLDEPEIGMSEESQAGLAEYINSRRERILVHAGGILVITHSRQIVSRLNADVFLNMEGMTRSEWLCREIVPTDFDALEKESLELQQLIQSRLRKD